MTALWRQPQNYARFLAQELSQRNHGSLLVVMPNGYGGYQSGAAGATISETLSRLAAPGSRLGDGAITAASITDNGARSSAFGGGGAGGSGSGSGGRSPSSASSAVNSLFGSGGGG